MRNATAILIAAVASLAGFAIIVRLAIGALFLYYFFFDTEALLAWASKWWQPIVAVAGVYHLLSGFKVDIKTRG